MAARHGPGLLGAALAALLAGCAGISSALPGEGKFIDTVSTRASPPEPEPVVLRPFNQKPAGIARNPPIKAYLTNIMNNLGASVQPVPAIPIFLTPVATFESDVSPGGAIFISLGSLRYLSQTAELRTEDDVAFLVAHELSHVLLGHTADRMATRRTVETVSGLISIGAVIAAGSSASQVAHAGMIAVGANFGSIEAIDNSVFPQWSRGQELQADLLAIDLMARAGYSVEVVPDILKVIAEDEARADAEADSARQKLVEQIPNGVRLNPGTLLQQGWEMLGKSHPDARERIEQAQTYISREYGTQVVPVRRRDFEAFVSQPSFQAAMRDMATLSAVESQLARKDSAGALARLRRLGPSMADSQYALYLTANAQANLGNGQAVKAVLARGMAMPERTEQVALAWGSLLQLQGRKEEALQSYEQSQAHFGDPTLFAYRIKVLKQLGRGNEATLLRMQCYANGQPDVQFACDAASK